jgi:two-component system sensor histidine kinase KdpD
MLYVLLVAFIAYKLDRWQSIIGAISAVLLLNFFFVPPTWTFHVDRSEHLIALGAMLIVALAINQLTTNLKRQTARAIMNEQRARQLQELAICLTTAESISAIKTAGQRTIQNGVHRQALLVLKDEELSQHISPTLSQQQIHGLQHCMKEVQVLGAGSTRWGELDDWYIPIGHKDHGLGAVLIPSVAGEDPDNQAHTQAICSLLTQAFERLQFNRHMQSAQHEAQKQQLQSTFLAAISHDLRTPLAVMVGAASALRSQGNRLSQDQQNRMLQSIVDEANYLTSVAENTLQLVRLTQTEIHLRFDWESFEEIVGAVFSRIKQGDKDARLQAKIETDLPLLRLDPVLIAQLLSNLIDNALKYSDDLVELEVSVDRHSTPATLQVAVMDRGPGIPVAEHKTIFEAYSRLAQHDQSTQRSAGLGLAVCHAIAVAHEGQLIVEDRAHGGSCFILTLNIPQTPSMHSENERATA